MTKTSAAGLLLILLAAGALGVCLVFQNLKEKLCVKSVEGAISKALEHDLDLSRKIVVTNEWRTLDEAEERILFNKFVADGETSIVSSSDSTRTASRFEEIVAG